MLSRAIKAGFYLVASPIMRLNAQAHRVFNRRPATAPLRVHLGPGQNNYLSGWVNVDANMFTARCDLWADLRYPLPFAPSTVEAFYSHHVIEHLPDLRSHFLDVCRRLRPGGVYRVGGPHGDNAIERFIASDSAWFSDFPDRRSSIGGRLDNFLLCRNEHLAILTRSYLNEIATDAGLELVTECSPGRTTNFPQLFGDVLRLESESDESRPHTLLMEFRKPSSIT